MSAALIRNGGKYVLLFADGGYARKSWEQLIPPGTALDAGQALSALRWIKAMSESADCLESLATHDPDVGPHTVVL